MPIDWTTIPFMPLGLLAALTFVSSLIGNSLSRSAFVGSILTVIIFVAFYIFWNHYDTPLQAMAGDVHFPNTWVAIKGR
jgi:hypothetical protein